MPPAPSIITPPPNTNSYGCHLVWDAVPFADQYRVFLGSSPDQFQNITNVIGTDAIFRIAQTNSRPWVGVKAVSAGGESDMAIITVTNYLAGQVEAASTLAGPWQAVPGTSFLLEATNPASFVRTEAGLSNNWPRLP